MTSCEVVLVYSHLANNKSKRKHIHFQQHTNFYFKLQMPYHHCQRIQRTMQEISTTIILQSNIMKRGVLAVKPPARFGSLSKFIIYIPVSNTPHFMILLIIIRCRTYYTRGQARRGPPGHREISRWAPASCVGFWAQDNK